MNTRDDWNGCRYQRGSTKGHYESWFQRANHPTRSLAFWVRYTIFSPKGNPGAAVGELWAVYFDGEANTIKAVKEVLPLNDCEFASTGLHHRIATSTLDAASLKGEAKGQGHELRWDLRYTSPNPHLLFLPKRLYAVPFPKAKALVGSPLAVYDGTLKVDGEEIAIDGWIGSQNHNWGVKHTDRYAWGQVSGFENAPDAFFEVATARVKLGPIWTPWMTLMVLRVGGEEYRLNSIPQAIRADGEYGFFHWTFSSKTRRATIKGSISASADAFVGLPYDNPPGGRKTCLNSKIASCKLTLQRPGQAPLSLNSPHRAAFEILTDAKDHGVAVLEA